MDVRGLDLLVKNDYLIGVLQVYGELRLLELDVVVLESQYQRVEGRLVQPDLEGQVAPAARNLHHGWDLDQHELWNNLDDQVVYRRVIHRVTLNLKRDRIVLVLEEPRGSEL